MKKKNCSILASIFLASTTLQGANTVTYVRSGSSHVYYEDITPEYKKSPSGYLTAFAQGYFDFNAFGLIYALGDAGYIMQPEKLQAIRNRLTFIRTRTLNALKIYEKHDAPYHRPHLYKAAAQFSMASCFAGACLYQYTKINSYDGPEQYILPTCTGLLSLPWIPFGMRNIVHAHPTIHAQALNTRLYEVDSILKLIDDLLEKRETQN